ncbi:MAG: hypothetical protein CL607_23750 [Anaerolineaceae bacterium]|nr:hypothetical protein [Anaerolineaceae bacterium]
MTMLSDCDGFARRGVRESAAGTTSLPALLIQQPAFSLHPDQPAGIPQARGNTSCDLTPLPHAAYRP